MAALCRNVARLVLREKQPICAICVRNSRYDSRYVENTRTLEELKQPIPEEDFRRFAKIKAAGTDDNTFTDFDVDIQKFTNMLMRNGNKKLAKSLVEKAFEQVKRIQVESYHKASTEEEKAAIELNPVTVFHKAIENGQPLLIITKVIKGGLTYQVPIATPDVRKKFLSMKWLINASKEKDKNKRFHEQLGEEIVAAYHHKGGLIKKKQEMHKLCETNKAFSHLSH